MSKFVAWKYACPSLVALTLISCLASPAGAQAADPNPGNLTITGAVDVTNNYMFRGIRQDVDPKVIVQPYFDLGIAMHSADAGLKSVGVNFGTWNSLHTGGSGLDSASGKLWYRSDFYAALGLGFTGGTFNVQYTAYTSPNLGFTTIKEVSLKFTGDDSGALGKAAVHPYALVAVEFDTQPGVGQADGSLNAGKYLELGAAPGYAAAKASLTVPVKVGLSLGDYYELAGTDNRFGYVSLAGVVTVPITNGSSAYGSWNFHASAEFQQLGKTTKALNGGDAQKTIVTSGLGFSY